MREELKNEVWDSKEYFNLEKYPLESTNYADELVQTLGNIRQTAMKNVP